MNIFVLDEDPNVAASFLCDIHVNKMLLESAQLLCGAHRFLDGYPGLLLRKDGKIKPYPFIHDTDVTEDAYFTQGPLYLVSHPHHPSSKWLRESTGNYQWLLEHYYALCRQYEKRFKKEHKTTQKMNEIKSLLDRSPNNLEDGPRRNFKAVMPEEFISGTDDSSVVESYQSYYRMKRDTMLRFNYTESPVPEFLGD